MREHVGELLAPAILVAASVATGVLLLPGDRELALIEYKAQEFDVAKARYEKLLAAGDLSVGVVKPLMELHLQYGDVDKAVELLERFVSEHPEDVEARRTLGTFYQYAEQPEAYRRNLEAMEALDLSPEVLRELSRIYSARGELEAQIGVLEKLTERFPENAQELLDLAYLEARLQRFDEAVRTLDRLGERHPAELTPETVELKLNLLLDAGHAQRAFEEAAAWLARVRTPASAARTVDLFAFKGEPDLALQLLNPYEEVLEDQPPLLQQWAKLQMRTGSPDVVFARLGKMHEERRLPPEATPAFVELALVNGATADGFDAAFGVDTRALPEWLLAVLVDTARTLPDPARARELLARLGFGFFDRRPLARAGLLLASGQRSAATVALDAVDRRSLDPGARRELSALLEELGRPREAFEILSALARQERLSETWLPELARLAVSLDEAKASLSLFDAPRGGVEAERAWALVATYAGEGAAVARWLRDARPSLVTEALLLDLFYGAEATGAPELALESAKRLHAWAPESRERRVLLARSLTRTGEPRLALAYFRDLPPPETAEEEQAYLDALEGARKLDPTFGAELTAFLRRKLSEDAPEGDLVLRLVEEGDDAGALPALRRLAEDRPLEWLHPYAESAARAGSLDEVLDFLERKLKDSEPSAETRELMVTALMERGGRERALPYLKTLAETRGGTWSYAYAEALHDAGRDAELTRFWRGRALGAGVDPQERREAAYRLVEEGDRETARRVFLDLARSAPAGSTDVSELLFLEGAPPQSETLDWLEGRARGASGAERAAWMRHLVSAGASRRAASIATASETSPVVLQAHLEALAAAKLGPELREVAERLLAFETDPERLRQLARLAFEADELGTTRQTLQKLLSLAPADPDALQQLGLVAFMSADYSEAKRFFEGYHEVASPTYESEYYHGEVLLREGREHEAYLSYRRALERLGAGGALGFTERVTEAQLLHRLERHEEGFARFAALLEEAPQDAHLRADFVAALLETEDFEKAERLLREAGPEIRRGPGGLRLDLLEAHLRVRTLRQEEALDQLRALARRHPQNASVSASLASAEESAGRWMEAVEELGRAHDLAPENEDILEARDALHGRHAPDLGGETRQRILGNGERQNVLAVSGNARLTRALRFGLSFATAEARAFVGPELVSGRREHAALLARYDRPAGDWLEGGLHLVEGTPGASIELGAKRARSETTATFGYGLPYWDLPAGVLVGALRDRLRAGRDQSFARRLHGRAFTSLSRYRLERGAPLFRSFGIGGDVTYGLRLSNPTVSVQYLLDAEYVHRLSATTAFDGALPLVSREVHGGGTILSAGLTRRLRSDAVAGYSWDRLGGAAPYFGLHLSYEIPEDLVARFSFERRLVAVDTSFAESFWSATFFWRF